MTEPRLLIPAIYVKHEPLLRKRLYVHRINQNIHVHWRLPMIVGRFIARRLRG